MDSGLINADQMLLSIISILLI